jgi:signal transduction histidine kinase
MRLWGRRSSAPCFFLTTNARGFMHANSIFGTMIESIVARRGNPPSLAGSVVISPRNLSLRETQLRVAELGSANRHKDAFLALLAHELRSPLEAIHYAVRLMESQVGGVPAGRLCAIIERQLGRITHLVDDLQDVTRISSGRLHLQRERIDLRDIVSNAIETIQSTIDEHKHRLSIELPATPMWLSADRYRLEQVLVNLLANASRYTDPGGELTVWVHARHMQAIVRIRDSGIGITAEAMPHIFDLFKQGNEPIPLQSRARRWTRCSA